MLTARLSGTPDLLELHRLAPERYPFLLESTAEHPANGRFGIAFAFPQEALVSRAGDLDAAQWLDSLRSRLEDTGGERDQELPFCGGWFLLLGYEMVRGFEPQLCVPDSPHRLPDALAVRCTAAVIVDRLLHHTTLVAESDAGQLEQLRRDCRQMRPYLLPESRTLASGIEEDPEQDFLDGVLRVREYLHAGDIFQANLSRAWRGRLIPGVSHADLYARLRQTNPAPFAGFATWEGCTVVSSSPERLALVDAGMVQTRPIAGTRARRVQTGEDLVQRDTLLQNLKERAEHLMLIDLERNDLGRVCQPGSVTVDELMAVESYAHVHHIVSNVSGRLNQALGAVDVLRAVFPGGTITGCPKWRSMQIIAELEGTGRGPYTGAMGYISRCGRMDTNILIRTLVCEDRQVHFRAGAGIVADSEPAAELAETRAKARGLLMALGLA